MKIAIGALVLVALVGVLWMALGSGDGGPPVAAGGGVAAPEAAPPQAEVEEAGEGSAEPTRSAARAPSGLPAVASPSARRDPWRGELAGLAGRVVEADGTPVPDISVALLEFEASLLFGESWAELGEGAPSLQLEETRTDEEGRFLLAGASRVGFHGLGVDLGGSRGTLRVVDQSLHHGERIDLGDVVLAPFAVFTGRVVDEEGGPVPGARVRVAAAPEEVIELGLHNLRSDSLLGVMQMLSAEEDSPVVELPEWIRVHVDRLPIPTTHSDGTGAFRLEGVPLSPVILAVDKPGWEGLVREPTEVELGELDLGDLILPRGRTLKGVVVDMEGEPVEGVEVYAGAEVPMGEVAILQPAGRTGPDGRFALAGVRSTGRAVATARRGRNEPWASTVIVAPGELRIEMESAFALTVHVRDASGEPLEGARISLTPAVDPDSPMGFVGGLLTRPRPLEGDRLSEVEPGTWLCRSLTPGNYELCARVEGFAPARSELELWEGEAEVTLTCPAGVALDLTVVDDASGEPVAGARASIVSVQFPLPSSQAVGRTDAQGEVRLGPYTLPSSDPDEPDWQRQQRRTGVLVQHPRFAQQMVDLPAGSSQLVVRLSGGGTLAGRIHWGGAVPTRPYMVTLMNEDADGFMQVIHLPRLGLSDLAGEFRFTGLPAASYEVGLYERFFGDDPLQLIGEQREPTLVHREDVQIESGQTTEMVIDLSPTGMGPTAIIVGQVRVDGRPVEGASVRVRGTRDLELETDPRGRFETGDISVLRSVRVSIEAPVSMPGGGSRKETLYSERLELEAGEVREIDLDYYPLQIQVEVADAQTGEPLTGARVQPIRMKEGRRHTSGSSRVQTDVAGQASLLLLEPGSYRLEASCGGYLKTGVAIEVPEEGLAVPVRIDLGRAVPCAGRIELGAAGAGRTWTYVSIESTDGEHQDGVFLGDGELEFEVSSLGEGTYRAVIYLDGELSEPIEFSLGPQGDTHLVLSYEPQGGH